MEVSLDAAGMRKALALEDLNDDVSIQFRASAINALLAGVSRVNSMRAKRRCRKVRQHYLDRGAERDLMAVAGYRTMSRDVAGGSWQTQHSSQRSRSKRSEQLGGKDINVIPLSVKLGGRRLCRTSGRSPSRCR